MFEVHRHDNQDGTFGVVVDHVEVARGIPADQIDGFELAIRETCDRIAMIWWVKGGHEFAQLGGLGYEGGLMPADPGVPEAIRAMGAEEAVDYCLARGFWLRAGTGEDEGRLHYGINHADQEQIVEALAEKKPAILDVLRRIEREEPARLGLSPVRPVE